MNTTAGGPAGLLVLTAWTEPGGRVRIRIMSTTDVASDQHTTSYAASKSEVIAEVAWWLDGLSMLP